NTRLQEVETEKRKVEAEKQRADEEKQIAQAVNDFLQNKLLAQASTTVQADALMRAGRSSEEAKLNPTIRELLDRAAKELAADKIEANFPKQPLVQAQILRTVAGAYRGIGEAAIGLPFLVRSRDLFKTHAGPDHPSTLTSMNNLAVGYHDAGKLDLALPLFEETLQLTKARLGPGHPDTLQSMNNLAVGYHDAGKLDLALPLFEETLQLKKAGLGPDHPDTLIGMNSLASGYRDAGKLDLALPLFEETLRLMKAKFGPDHPHTIIGMNSLASGYRDAGNLDKALLLYEETLKLSKAKLGPDHPQTLIGMNNLASGYRDAGNLDKALLLYEETLKLSKAKLGPDHPHTYASIAGLAACYWSLRRLDQSVPLFEQLLPFFEKKLGRTHPNTQMMVANLGVNYRDAGRLKEAIPLLEEAHTASKTHAQFRLVGLELLDAYAKSGKPAEASKLIGELLADVRQATPKDSPQLGQQLAQYGLKLLEMHGFAQAEPLLRECLAIREKTEPDVWTTFNTQSMLGAAYLGQKKYADAEPLLLKGYEGLKARENSVPPPDKDRIPEALDRLIELYTAMNKPDEVKKYQELRAKYPGAKMEPEKK
ncbi:MAG: tetratricopeptide repeat protein, partial [Gemmataceae bacterium]|nr:tetratricopeptide repeat protein [Gemmataceae bacterium]